MHGMGFYHHGRGGRRGRKGQAQRKGHPVFSSDRRGSREKFRSFIEERGIFGRKTPPEEEAEPEEAPAAEESKDGEAAEPDAKRSTWSYLKSYLGLLSGTRLRLVAVMILSPVLVALHAIMPWSSKYFIDTVLPARDGTFLLQTCGVLFALMLLWILLNMVQDYWVRCLRGNMVTHTKRRLMKHLQQMPLERLQDLKVGGIISRLQSDTESAAGLLQQALLTPLNALLMFVGGIGSLVAINWQVTLICMCFCLLIIGVAYTLFNVMRPFQRMLREELAAIGGNLTETFGGIQIVRAFSRERAEAKAFSKEVHLLWRKGLWASVLNMLVHRSIHIVHVLIYLSIWSVGGYFYIQGKMQVGELVAFTMFIGWLFQPIFMIMASFSSMQTSFACAERIFDLLDEPPAMPDKAGATGVEEIAEGFAFEDVTFDYPDGTRALENVSFAIPRGTVTALVGPSGAGKTTITNLVMRFYDVTQGRVTLDCQDIRDFRLSDYRNLSGLVLQEIFLFDGTVRENIAYSVPGASQEQIEEAARMAHCTEFIDGLEKKYDTIIGERGVKLSTGQKQRLSLARALLKDPQLLILDEATSNLDSESEALIQDALRHIFDNRTTIVIAHRLSTIMDADNIIVVDKGRIAEQGTHRELLQKQGRYYELYNKQMAKAEKQKKVFDWSEE